MTNVDTRLLEGFSIGADPEVFAFRGKTPVSVHDLIPGSKAQPHKVPDGAIQVDGTAAEFNIDPCFSKQEFLDRIASVRSTLQAFLSGKDKDLVLLSRPYVKFGKDYFNTIPVENKELGCDPDFDAWAGGIANVKPDPESIGMPTLRTGSGHIHIGWPVTPEKDVHFLDCIRIVKELDKAFRPIEPLWDSSKVRRNLYGKKGAFRPKPYGVEYRVLSNRWVDNPYVQEVIFDTVNAVCHKLVGQPSKAPFPKVDRQQIKDNWVVRN